MDILIDSSYDGLIIREVLSSKLGYSSNLIKKLKFSEGGITVNGNFVTVRYVLKKGDILSLRIEDSEADVSPYTIPNDIPLEVIYEDAHVTVVNKPPDMPAHPSLGHQLDTVANALAYRYSGKPYVFRPVNRLDRDTSGCMLTANSKADCYRMYLAMTEGRIKKSYIAVLDGVPKTPYLQSPNSDSVLNNNSGQLSGRIESYMRRAEGSIIKREETSAGSPEAKLAVTEYRIIYNNERYSLVEAFPITGRTHQLRVQFAGIGCPIVGDTLYGTGSEHISRHALHCIRTSFPHPATGETIEVQAPVPGDIERLLAACFGKNPLN